MDLNQSFFFFFFPPEPSFWVAPKLLFKENKTNFLKFILVSPKMKYFIFYLLKQNFVFKKMFLHMFQLYFHIWPNLQIILVHLKFTLLG